MHILYLQGLCSRGRHSIKDSGEECDIEDGVFDGRKRDSQGYIWVSMMLPRRATMPVDASCGTYYLGELRSVRWSASVCLEGYAEWQGEICNDLGQYGRCKGVLLKETMCSKVLPSSRQGSRCYKLVTGCAR